MELHRHSNAQLAQTVSLLRHSGVTEGQPFPLGATWDGLGVNFALFSTHATKVKLCLINIRPELRGRGYSIVVTSTNGDKNHRATVDGAVAQLKS